MTNGGVGFQSGRLIFQGQGCVECSVDSPVRPFLSENMQIAPTTRTLHIHTFHSQKTNICSTFNTLDYLSTRRADVLSTI